MYKLGDANAGVLENADRILVKPQQKTGMDYLSAGKPGPDFFFLNRSDFFPCRRADTDTHFFANIGGRSDADIGSGRA